MKAKRLISLAIAALLLVMTAVSASAEIALTDQEPGGDTEVKAHISGGNPPGEVSYTIMIPDAVDFGELKQPTENVDDYKDAAYTVKATKIDGLDPTTQQVSVYVRDQNATASSNQDFKITNKSDSSVSFIYEVYRSESINPANLISGNGYVGTVGYFLYGFTEQGQALTGTLRLNQAQLYGRNITDLIGEYSGYMVFYSAVESQN